MITLAKLNPLNKAEEKKKFFFDSLYNPQFIYSARISDRDKGQYGEVSDEFLPKAEKILQTVLKKWGNESVFLAEAEGELMTREEVQRVTIDYLRTNKIENKVQVKFTLGQVSPASMNGNLLSFRLPIAERTKRLEGTLHHEVGTHYFRRLNDLKQPWFGHKEKLGFRNHLETEEGLAIINSHVFLEHKYLWFAALYYMGVFYSNRLSFSDLNKHLKPYIDDRERRWNITLRLKRGMGDTSVPGAIAKDQVYLKGIIKVLSWLEEHNYDPSPLYIGKIALEDLELAHRQAVPETVLLPEFLQPEHHAEFVAGVKNLKKTNFL